MDRSTSACNFTNTLCAANLLRIRQRRLSWRRSSAGITPDVRLHRVLAQSSTRYEKQPVDREAWCSTRSRSGISNLVQWQARCPAQESECCRTWPRRCCCRHCSRRPRGISGGAVIFLDQEEGGSLLPEQVAYIGAWIAGLGHSRYKPGVYCSGIAVPSGPKMISTAEHVESRFAGVKLWVWNDRCPPAPGCIVADRGFDPAQSGFSQALVWQYAQSPRRPENTAACQRTYAQDGMCYVPRLPHSRQTYVDLNISRLPDPSRGR